MVGVIQTNSRTKERMPGYVGRILRDASTHLFDIGTSEGHAGIERLSFDLDEVAVALGGGRKIEDILKGGRIGVSADQTEEVLRISRELGELSSQNGYRSLPDLSFLLSELFTCGEGCFRNNRDLYGNLLKKVLGYDDKKIGELDIFENGNGHHASYS